MKGLIAGLAVLFALGVLFFIYTSETAPPAEMPDHREANKQTVREVYAALDAQDFDRLNDLMAPDLAIKVVGTVEGFPWSAAVSDLIPAYYGAFEGYHHVIDQLVAEDDWVVARLTYHGTHTGDFMGASATGNQMTYGGIHMLRIGMDLFPVEEG